MKRDKSNDETFLQLTNIANNFKSTEENYLLSYPYFLNYFQNLESINLENLVIGISFTYSWMPTILKALNLKNTEKVVFILNEVKKGKLIDEQQLTTLKTTFNNSLVGTSKLLHFINPKQYAIWDSSVFRFLNNVEPHKYRLEKPRAYIEYLKLIEELKNEKAFTAFFELMKQKVGYDITEYRALELAFFKGTPFQNK
ncbi:hypothetical protein N5J50_03735 [Acinetobacter johnsonii]|uniref:Uncharacterized protein n=1 Tax=Acinetobacter johnsonii TaxID=40214 RepID=A0A510WUF5_ACIJO|nr:MULTISPECIES: hypothetical protein [Acinetobacter]MDH0656969.1 hypothetical protein [Acinetobacter johnsonii]MDH2171707.1 hypothetical protein [Acinetobacter johnsonii]MDH2174806.1 hypothetical protein [Acinetobacter johnsonii]OOW15601.1 hypothetical protein MF4640_03500 [Acinetobacter sp. MF4640]PZO93815.1 MAG: hypothetical protein DI631_05670 [Acinetobacter johnsonii]